MSPINLFTGQQNYTPEERKQQRINEYKNSIAELQELSQRRQDELNHAREVVQSHTQGDSTASHVYRVSTGFA